MDGDCRSASGGPWEDPRFPLAIAEAAGLPEPAQRCRGYRPDNGPCQHYALLEVTVGCEHEHIGTAPCCECCLAYLASRPLLACGECWGVAAIITAVPLYPGVTGHDELVG
jgi:hypothetical protein